MPAWTSPRHRFPTRLTQDDDPGELVDVMWDPDMLVRLTVRDQGRPGDAQTRHSRYLAIPLAICMSICSPSSMCAPSSLSNVNK